MLHNPQLCVSQRVARSTGRNAVPAQPLLGEALLVIDAAHDSEQLLRRESRLHGIEARELVPRIRAMERALECLRCICDAIPMRFSGRTNYGH